MVEDAQFCIGKKKAISEITDPGQLKAPGLELGRNIGVENNIDIRVDERGRVNTKSDNMQHHTKVNLNIGGLVNP